MIEPDRGTGRNYHRQPREREQSLWREHERRSFRSDDSELSAFARPGPRSGSIMNCLPRPDASD